MFVHWRMGIHSARHPRRVAALLLVLAVAGGASACSRVPGVYTYVPAGETAGAGAGGKAAFDKQAFVDGVWQSKVLPAVDADAVDATTLLPALAADPESASKQYGSQAGTGSPYAFLVRGTGTVTEVDEEAPSHPVTVKVDGLEGKDSNVQVVTGPVIAGTALRDAVKFIKFSDFTNQLDYADAGTGLNEKVKSDVLAGVSAKDLVGKKVDFAGAFSMVAPGVVLVVPTRLEPVS
jgi:predicted lipoprotein